tara:strand:- start:594 stop:1256 length:663 start_codon:yes stop_codon:yes gene_type:complete
MKKIIFTLTFALLYCGLSAQQKHDYYIVATTNSLITPTNKTSLPNNSFDLQFTNNDIENFFANKIVYSYEQAFPTSVTPYLQKVFKATLDNNTYLDEILSLNGIEHAELLDQPILTHTPNDYNYLGVPQPNLELIKAQQAWDITTGDPNVIIGITDTYFEATHQDLTNQIVQNIDNNSSTNGHGTRVAGCAAAETNNSIGVSGIGYNCKLITSDVWASDN